MSFSVSSRHDDFEYASQGANAIFAKRSHLVRPRFYRMLAEKVRFHREARRLLEQLGEGPTLGEFLDARRYSRTFIDRLIVPQVAAVWSAPEEEARAFPAKYLARFLDNHGLLQVGNHPRWSTVPGGSARYVEAMTRTFRRKVRLQAPVVSIRRDQDSVEIRQRNGRTGDLRPRDRGHPLRPGAAHAQRPHAARARAAQRLRVPGQRGGPAHRCPRAAPPPPGLGELELPGRRPATPGAAR